MARRQEANITPKHEQKTHGTEGQNKNEKEGNGAKSMESYMLIIKGLAK